MRNHDCFSLFNVTDDASAKSLQSCLTLCNPPGGPPGPSVHGILQVRILEWLPCPPPGELPDPGIEPASPVSAAWQVASLPLSHRGNPGMMLSPLN